MSEHRDDQSLPQAETVDDASPVRDTDAASGHVSVSSAGEDPQGRVPRPRRRSRARWGGVATACVTLLAGYLLAVSATTAGGTDLRPERAGDLSELVRDRASRVEQLQRDAADLRAEVDQLSAADKDDQLSGQLQQAGVQAMTTVVKGPAVSVTLDDAPLSVNPVGIDEDLLVVHQQDIQQVANVLWQAGAEAMTIQGQRVVATTGIKCVGNTVVLHGVPYAPPYVITAIGDQSRLEQGLRDDGYLTVYREYASQYQLGYTQTRIAEAVMPAAQVPIELSEATPAPK